MSTRPREEVLGRERFDDHEELRSLLERLAGGVEETVNFGTQVFAWCNEGAAGHSDEVAPLILSLRHALQMFDAISVLIKEGVVEPCNHHLRSAFESVLTIEYILEGSLEKRAMAFMVWHVHQRKKLYNKYDPQTEMGKQLVASLEGSPVENVSVEEEFDLEAAQENLDSLLKKEKYQEAEAEYQRLRDRGKRNPDWYEFYGGPRSIEQLAREVDKEHWYQVVYRQWSRSVHATNIITGNLLSAEDGTAIPSLRQPFEVESKVSFCITLAIQVYRSMIEELAPERKKVFKKWYTREIRDFYQTVSENTLISKAT